MTADFSLGQPEYFVAVANTGSMRAAAVRCHAYARDTPATARATA